MNFPSYDFSEQWTVEQAEEELDNDRFKFNGEGWYLTATDSLFVVKCDKPYGEQRYNFYFFLGNPNAGQLFGDIANAPVKSDKR